ncbi:MAG: hypothetical protein PHN49_01270 [Candidatus Omnitrophica bacterium]|nr:hypothetical protein [Candidatus Omnitrophota bacterium]
MFRAANHSVNDYRIAAPGHKAEIFPANRAHVYAQIARAVIVLAKAAVILRVCFVPAKEINYVLNVSDDNPVPLHIILCYLPKRKSSALPESLWINPLLVDNALYPNPSAV